nr:MAG TPA: hypothetical protein [Caudoviricetes sp.]
MGYIASLTLGICSPGLTSPLAFRLCFPCCVFIISLDSSDFH